MSILQKVTDTLVDYIKDESGADPVFLKWLYRECLRELGSDLMPSQWSTGMGIAHSFRHSEPTDRHRSLMRVVTRRWLNRLRSDEHELHQKRYNELRTWSSHPFRGALPTVEDARRIWSRERSDD